MAQVQEGHYLLTTLTAEKKKIYQKQQYIDESNAFAFWQVKYICGIWYSYVYMITIYPIWYFFLTD